MRIDRHGNVQRTHTPHFNRLEAEHEQALAAHRLAREIAGLEAAITSLTGLASTNANAAKALAEMQDRLTQLQNS